MTALPESAPDSNGLRPTRALLRGLSVLEAVGSSSDGASLVAIATHAGLDKATTLRMLHTLASAGYVRHDPATGIYRLTSRLAQLGRQGHDHSDLVARCRTELEHLVEQTQETVNLGVFDVDRVTYVDQVESPQSVRLVSAVGRSLPLHTTAIGKAMLSAMTEDARERVLRSMTFTREGPQSILTIAEFRAEIERTRARGYAVDEQENEAGVTCVGVAILAVDGEIEGGISVSGPAFRMTGQLETIGRLLLDVSARVEAGHTATEERTRSPHSL